MIELPPRIAALPRSAAGIPVPHVARWTSEANETQQYVAPDPVLRGRPALFCRGQQGVGDPDFGTMENARQRRAVVLLRCQVCDRRLKRGHGWLVCEEDCVRRITTPGPAQGQIAFGEPWVCWPCVEVAARICPGLVRRARRHRGVPRDTLRVIRPSRWVIALRRGSHDLLPETSDEQMVMWCDIVPEEIAETRYLAVGRRAAA